MAEGRRIIEIPHTIQEFIEGWGARKIENQHDKDELYFGLSAIHQSRKKEGLINDQVIRESIDAAIKFFNVEALDWLKREHPEQCQQYVHERLLQVVAYGDLCQPSDDPEINKKRQIIDFLLAFYIKDLKRGALISEALPKALLANYNLYCVKSLVSFLRKDNSSQHHIAFFLEKLKAAIVTLSNPRQVIFLKFLIDQPEWRQRQPKHYLNHQIKQGKLKYAEILVDHGIKLYVSKNYDENNITLATVLNHFNHPNISYAEHRDFIKKLYKSYKTNIDETDLDFAIELSIILKNPDILNDLLSADKEATLRLINQVSFWAGNVSSPLLEKYAHAGQIAIVKVLIAQGACLPEKPLVTSVDPNIRRVGVYIEAVRAIKHKDKSAAQRCYLLIKHDADKFDLYRLFHNIPGQVEIVRDLVGPSIVQQVSEQIHQEQMISARLFAVTRSRAIEFKHSAEHKRNVEGAASSFSPSNARLAAVFNREDSEAELGAVTERKRPQNGSESPQHWVTSNNGVVSHGVFRDASVVRSERSLSLAPIQEQLPVNSFENMKLQITFNSKLEELIHYGNRNGFWRGNEILLQQLTTLQREKESEIRQIAGVVEPRERNVI